MDEEIEVAPSDENGNVPLDAPSEQPIEETPAEVETAQPAEPVAELFELPDGRKVDGAGLAKEWKENFLPEFTRKSQALSEIERGKTINPTSEKPYQNPEWQPQTYEELLKIAREDVLNTLDERDQARKDQQQALENSVATQLTEIKAADPNVNENALFAHAVKYGFQNLKTAHQNMKDMSELAKKVQTTTAANIAKRNDPVSVSPGAVGQKSDPANFRNATEFLRSLK